MNFIQWFDGLLPSLFEKISSPALDKVAVFITNLGDGGVIWLAIIAVLLVTKKYRKTGIIALVSLVVCLIVGNYIIKPLIGRIRPCNLDPSIKLLIPRLTDFSFPSMHTATSFAASVVLLRKDKRIGIPAVIVAILMGLSRIYLYMHYTTDVICGMVLGIAFAYLFVYLFKKKKIF